MMGGKRWQSNPKMDGGVVEAYLVVEDRGVTQAVVRQVVLEEVEVVVEVEGVAGRNDTALEAFMYR